jgi:hypothetical protein
VLVVGGTQLAGRQGLERTVRGGDADAGHGTLTVGEELRFAGGAYAL